MQESQPGRSYPNMGFDLQKDRGHENQASNFDRASHEHFSVMSSTMLFLHAFCLNISINIHTSIQRYIYIYMYTSRYSFHGTAIKKVGNFFSSANNQSLLKQTTFETMMFCHEHLSVMSTNMLFLHAFLFIHVNTNIHTLYIYIYIYTYI